MGDYTSKTGSEGIGAELTAVARAAENAGFDRFSLKDHVWQNPPFGPPEDNMLEAYTTLGYLAAVTSRISLYTLVTAAVYRAPGLLAKTVTTLDVLSGGRAALGIGAAWNEEEARGLGLDFPPLAERFERLEEALQICLQMWSDDESPYHGKHYQLGQTLNSPQPVSRPHPPILVGGTGEKKTLRLVAKYAQACNFNPSPELARKLDVLREHCDREGGDYDGIEKTVSVSLDVGENGEKVGQVLKRLRSLAEMGFTVGIGHVPNVRSITPLEIIGREIIPAAAEI
ncbi:LLM class F420-dependent oxidoreductase [Streptomyces sp. NPDC048251]|uniref:LLM class F420-dependent oxidoreductase n=1 Tax=Streptomyces sp. NPDC048251 TaxID=3154501 RepID=UPI00342FE051